MRPGSHQRICSNDVTIDYSDSKRGDTVLFLFMGGALIRIIGPARLLRSPKITGWSLSTYPDLAGPVKTGTRGPLKIMQRMYMPLSPHWI